MVPDMTVISDIDEHGINKNLQKRYKKNKIYVSILKLYFRFLGVFNTNLYDIYQKPTDHKKSCNYDQIKTNSIKFKKNLFYRFVNENNITSIMHIGIYVGLDIRHHLLYSSIAVIYIIWKFMKF